MPFGTLAVRAVAGFESKSALAGGITGVVLGEPGFGLASYTALRFGRIGRWLFALSTLEANFSQYPENATTAFGAPPRIKTWPILKIELQRWLEMGCIRFARNRCFLSSDVVYRHDM
jgi:hypothetical protein